MDWAKGDRCARTEEFRREEGSYDSGISDRFRAPNRYFRCGFSYKKWIASDVEFLCSERRSTVAVGAILGLVVMLNTILRLHREIRRLTKKHEMATKEIVNLRAIPISDVP